MNREQILFDTAITRPPARRDEGTSINDVPTDLPPIVVLVDDDPFYREAMSLNLARQGLRVTALAGGKAAIDYFVAKRRRADLLLLDWRMPGMSGLDVLHALTVARVNVPTIFLTGEDSPEREVRALSGGAIDYVGKQRGFRIALHRIGLVLKRRKPAAAERPTPRAGLRHVGPLALDIDCHRALWRGRPVQLTITEYRMVALLAERAGLDVTYRELYDVVHGVGFMAGSEPEGHRVNVRSFIKRIRRKFAAIDPGFDRIDNYPGYGYRWLAGADGDVPTQSDSGRN